METANGRFVVLWPFISTLVFMGDFERLCAMAPVYN